MKLRVPLAVQIFLGLVGGWGELEGFNRFLQVLLAFFIWFSTGFDTGL